MTYFVRSGNSFRLAADSAIDISDALQPATYVVKVDDAGLFLEIVDNFNLPAKVYGDCLKNADRIINTFLERPNATGVYLEGEKGSGKTLLGKSIACKMLDLGYATLIVNSPLYGDAFNTFIQSIRQPTVVIFDEFEKVYDEEQQERILTLFDGVYPSKKLFVVTVNDSYRVDKNLKNRPGRMFYMMEFGGVDEAFVKDYLDDKLINKSHKESVISVVSLFGKFNFDMLQALVEEMNRYGETAQEALSMLNAKPSNSMGTYKVEVNHPTTKIRMPDEYKQMACSPMSDSIRFVVYNAANENENNKVKTAETKWPSEERIVLTFGVQDLIKVDAGVFSYVNSEGYSLKLTKVVVDATPSWAKFV